MPKDNSIKSVLIIGSGPIVIGQACEFDYSGSQASRSLQEEGIEVTLLHRIDVNDLGISEVEAPHGSHPVEAEGKSLVRDDAPDAVLEALADFLKPPVAIVFFELPELG